MENKLGAVVSLMLGIMIGVNWRKIKKFAPWDKLRDLAAPSAALLAENLNEGFKTVKKEYQSLAKAAGLGNHKRQTRKADARV